MKRCAIALAAAQLLACTRFGFGAFAVDGPGGPDDATAASDRARADAVPTDGPPRDTAPADQAGTADQGALLVPRPPFGRGGWLLGPIAPVAELNSPDSDGPLSLTSDGLTAYFSSDRIDRATKDVFVARRITPQHPFASIELLAGVNTEGYLDELVETADGLTGFLTTDRPGGPGSHDIWSATRASRDAPWSSAQFAPLAFNTPADDYDPRPSADGLRLYYAPQVSNADQGIYFVARASRSAPFGARQPVPEVNSNGGECDPAFSPDERVLLFTSSPSKGQTGRDVYYAVRPSATAPFGDVQPLAAINTPSNDGEPFVSADGTELYFLSDRPGTAGYWDIYRAEILEGP